MKIVFCQKEDQTNSEVCDPPKLKHFKISRSPRICCCRQI